jgi:protein gp37
MLSRRSAMAEETLISWADMTFNPWIGCTRVSPACDGCYAAHLMETRMGRVQWGGPGVGNGTRSRTSEANWRKPLAWDRAAAKAGTRPFVFCSSLADVFDNQVPTEWRRDLFDLIEKTPHLIWLLLTKRPQNIVKLYEQAFDVLPWPKNAAIGTTVEDQERANKNIPALIAAKNTLKPAFAFLSCEPLLGRIDLEYPAGIWPKGPPICCSGIGSSGEQSCGCMGRPTEPPLIWGIDWVITGGETDQGSHKARPTHPDWFRSLRDQCADAGIPYHHKQNGEWLGGDQIPEDVTIPSGISNDCGISGADDNRRVWRVGKHFSGRSLDGVEHNGFPSIRRVA